ncbi:MAG TPA: hypothetical protein VK308_17130 [Pyrinomonadaceae bacterium]|nr:hypothetical protein [Pyrinomonadaceae bacterium]
MAQSKFKTAFVLSGVIPVLMFLASIGGILIEGVYRDNEFVASLWRGNDWVTLLVALPLLVGALFFARRGSTRAHLIWLGMLAYALYNYAFYLFAAAFNQLFLLYVAIFTLSIYALVFTLVKTDAEEIRRQFRDRTPVKLIGGYMLFIAAGLSFLWIGSSLKFVADGVVPEYIEMTGHPTGIVYALDLSLLVPVLILGGVWIWRREAWGFVLAAMSLIKGATYTLVLSVNSMITASHAEAPIWISTTAASLVAIGFLLGNMKRADEGEKL